MKCDAITHCCLFNMFVINIVLFLYCCCYCCRCFCFCFCFYFYFNVLLVPPLVAMHMCTFRFQRIRKWLLSLSTSTLHAVDYRYTRCVCAGASAHAYTFILSFVATFASLRAQYASCIGVCVCLIVVNAKRKESYLNEFTRSIKILLKWWWAATLQ